MKKAATIFILLSALLCGRAFAIDVHEMSGSDLGLGVGARAISMGGAFSALADNASTLYWNPGGLTEVKNNEAMMMVNTSPTRYSFKAFVFRPEIWHRSKSNLTIGIAQTNRLKYIADGDWSQGNASQLIDLSMINLDDTRNAAGNYTYVGGINSRTTDHRITVAARIPGYEKLSLGATYIDFKCVTTFYMSATPRICQTVAYTTMDFGALYKQNKNRQYAIALRNPLEKTKPKYLTLGAAWLRPGYRFTLDIERIFGEYGNDLRKCSFIMVRSGYERDFGSSFKARAGLIIPLLAHTSTLGNILAKTPSPKFDATMGLGYTFKNYTLDFAVYGDPGKSYVTESAKFGSVFTLKADF